MTKKSRLFDNKRLEITINRLCQELIENHKNFSDTIRLLARENQVKIKNIDIEYENLNILLLELFHLYNKNQYFQV